MKPPPKDWPRLSSAVFYEEPGKAIDWLCKAFGFEVRIKVEGKNGEIEHSELTFGEALLMVGGTQRGEQRRSPRSLGGANTQSLMLFVDDADEHYLRARAAGARIVSEPKTTNYGADFWTDRGYEVADPEGHHWWFVQRL